MRDPRVELAERMERLNAALGDVAFLLALAVGGILSWWMTPSADLINRVSAALFIGGAVSAYLLAYPIRWSIGRVCGRRWVRQLAAGDAAKADDLALRLRIHG